MTEFIKNISLSMTFLGLAIMIFSSGFYLQDKIEDKQVINYEDVDINYLFKLKNGDFVDMLRFEEIKENGITKSYMNKSEIYNYIQSIEN